MPREESHTARPSRAARPAAGAETAPRPVVPLLAHASQPVEMLPHLHQHALERTGGDCSLLFQHNPRNGTLQATSGFGLDALRTDPWLPDSEEIDIVARAFEGDARLLVTDAPERMPDLAARIGVPTALLLPLARGSERIGLLVIGFTAPPRAMAPDVSEVSRRLSHRPRTVPPAAERTASARRSGAARRVLEPPLVYLEPHSGSGQICHGANTALRRRPHCRSGFMIAGHAVWCCRPPRTRNTPRAAGGSAQTIRPRRRHWQCVACARKLLPGSGDDVTATVTVPLRGMPTSARHGRVRGRPDRAWRRAGPARSRRRARPPARQRD